MVLRLNDNQLVIGDPADETVLTVDAKGPEAGDIAAQRLRLAGALGLGAPGFLTQP